MRILLLEVLGAIALLGWAAAWWYWRKLSWERFEHWRAREALFRCEPWSHLLWDPTRGQAEVSCTPEAANRSGLGHVHQCPGCQARAVFAGVTPS